MTTLYLIRHGETETNNSGIVAGMYDAKLTDAGIKQGLLVAERFKDVHLDAIYSSDISRAVIMAKEIAKFHDLPVQFETRLREINLGDWEGRHVNELKEKWPKEYQVWMEDQGHCTCPNGESIQDVEDRVMSGIRAIVEKHPNQTVLCVTHGLALKTIFVSLRHASLLQFRNLKYVSNASITTIKAENGAIKLENYGDDSYLDADMITHIFSEA